MTGFLMFNYIVTAMDGLRAALICRFLSAACGSAAYVIPPGVFVDLYGPVGRAIGYQIFATAAFIGGSLGPGVAACMVSSGLDWRWPLSLVSITALPMILAFSMTPETLEPALLQQKARRLRLATGDWSWHAKRDETPVNLSNYLVKPWKMLVQEPVLIVVTTAFTMDYFIQTLTYSEIPIAFGMRHWDYTAAYLSLCLTLLGFALGCVILVVDTNLRFRKRHAKGLPIAPESRLPPIVSSLQPKSGIHANTSRSSGWRYYRSVYSGSLTVVLKRRTGSFRPQQRLSSAAACTWFGLPPLSMCRTCMSRIRIVRWQLVHL
ncbi:unnamed protein product [Cercospora beticola]|nr:unnamed protein product [Cercospora beticola]